MLMPDSLAAIQRRAASRRRANERLWSLSKDGKQVDCELKRHGEYGVEILFFIRGEFLHSRWFDRPEFAMVEASTRRSELEGDGWSSPA
jgi:hypothetical protein